MTTDPTTIANQFNTLFAGIGVELSANVNNTHNAHFTDYLLNTSMYQFTFELITEETTMEILNNLKPKPSCGYDGISTKLLKTCKLEIWPRYAPVYTIGAGHRANSIIHMAAHNLRHVVRVLIGFLRFRRCNRATVASLLRIR